MNNCVQLLVFNFFVRQWTSLTEQTLDLEDIEINKDSGERCMSCISQFILVYLSISHLYLSIS